ncbi:hypothetical protein Tsubulata_039323 [Turnera subulata]|uniref:DUF4283 domain-containing protein n=1 Tax=Turnera subulata TaxID=218843 RepID=A0A9Q0G2H6_9ROSI|nr:hypothetical protein Tsubulata_039323 [Turnera subulata]
MASRIGDLWTWKESFFPAICQAAAPVAKVSAARRLPRRRRRRGRRLSRRADVVSVTSYKDSLFLFHFPTEASLSRALYGGPWHIGGIPLLLHQWSSTIEPADFTADTFPVWVQLRHVPPELMTSEGLSYLANVVGKPMHTTQDYSKVFSDHANVCVEVDFSKPLVNSIPINVDGSLCTVDISYS